LNLLKKKSHLSEEEVTNGEFTISNFRSAQYALIEYFMQVSIEYIAKQNKNYMTVDKVSIYNIPTYVGVNYSLLTQIIVDVNIGGGKKTFVKFLIPTLVDGNFLY